MKAHKALSLFSFFALAGLLLTLTSCPASIYYTLENEVKTTDNTLSNDLWMHGMARIGTDYYLAAGKVYKAASTPTTVTWDTAAPLTPPAANALCNTIVAFGGELYGGFVTQGTSLGLYKASGAPLSFAGGQVGAFADRQVTWLGVVNAGSRIAVATADWDAATSVYLYNLYVAAAPDGSGQLIANAAKPIKAVAYTSTTGLYWAVTGSTLYKHDGVATLTAVPITGAVSGETLNTVFSDDETSRLWVTSSKGYVYFSPDEGASWYKNADDIFVNSYLVSFQSMAGASGSSNMLVAAEGESGGYGYYVANISGTAPSITVTLTRFAVSTIALYVSSIRGFLIDGSRLFAWSFGVDRGLWRNQSFNSADCSVGADWIQE